MTIYVPFGIVTILISFYLFYELKRARETRRDKRREELNNRRQELLDAIIKSKMKKIEPDGNETF